MQKRVNLELRGSKLIASTGEAVNNLVSTATHSAEVSLPFSSAAPVLPQWTHGQLASMARVAGMDPTT